MLVQSVVKAQPHSTTLLDFVLYKNAIYKNKKFIKMCILYNGFGARDQVYHIASALLFNPVLSILLILTI